MAAVGVQQHTALVGVVAGGQAGVVDIMAPAMATLMLLATMHHPWSTQLRRWSLMQHLSNLWSWLLNRKLQFGITAKQARNTFRMCKVAHRAGKPDQQRHLLVVRTQDSAIKINRI